MPFSMKAETVGGPVILSTVNTLWSFCIRSIFSLLLSLCGKPWGGFPGSTCWIAGFDLVGFEVGFLVRLVGLLGSTWWVCSKMDFLVRLVGLLSSTWWDLLGSEVGLLGSKVDFLVRLSGFWGGFARFAGFNLLEMGFSRFENFFFLGCLCCIFGLIWYFGVLGFDDFAGVWKNGGFEIYDFIFELNFLSFFFCVCFLRKFLGLL